MYKKYLSLILALTMMSAGTAAFADDETEAEETYATGSLEMTEEQVEALQVAFPQIADVRPNELLRQRVNEEQGLGDGESSGGGTLQIADDGDEIIIAADEPEISLMSGSVYPSRADNSKEETFPVIDNQGNLNSCVGWSLGYYQLTNNANKIRGLSAKNGLNTNNKVNVYSPNWIYNLGNKAQNNGMMLVDALGILYSYGCPNLDNVSLETKAETSYKTNYISWYPNAATWKNALDNKCEIYYGTVNPDKVVTPITSPDSSNLNSIKKLLADGYVVTIETYVNTSSGSYLPVVKTGRASDNKSAFVWTEARTVYGGGHAVTIVGYDDNFKVDINEDGVYQQGEYGAFKIANSWGKNVSRHNEGYVWLAYDALNEVSSVSSRNNNKRISAFRNGGAYYFVKPCKEYKPLLTAEIGMRTNQRRGMALKFGIVDVDNPQNYNEKWLRQMNTSAGIRFCDIAFGYSEDNGDYNFTGGTNALNAEFFFDLSGLLENYEIKDNHRYKVYVDLYDSCNSSKTALTSFKLTDNYNNATYTAENISDAPNMRAEVEYLSSIMSAQKGKSFTLTFNSKLDEDTVNSANIYIKNQDDDYMNIEPVLKTEREKVLLPFPNGYYKNNFYTIKISPELKSMGKNSMEMIVSKPFYVPFH